MRWIVSLSIVLGCAVTACGGPQIPTHNGYKPKEAKPWKKPKALKFDDKGEAKAEGDLSYPDMRRARWYELSLPSSGQLTANGLLGIIFAFALLLFRFPRLEIFHGRASKT